MYKSLSQKKSCVPEPESYRVACEVAGQRILPQTSSRTPFLGLKWRTERSPSSQGRISRNWAGRWGLSNRRTKSNKQARTFGAQWAKTAGGAEGGRSGGARDEARGGSRQGTEIQSHVWYGAGGLGQEPVEGRRGATLIRSGLRAGGGGRGWRVEEGLAARALAGAGRGMAERNG